MSLAETPLFMRSWVRRWEKSSSYIVCITVLCHIVSNKIVETVRMYLLLLLKYHIESDIIRKNR